MKGMAHGIFHAYFFCSKFKHSKKHEQIAYKSINIASAYYVYFPVLRL